MKGAVCGEGLPTNDTGIWGSVPRVCGSPAPWSLASLPLTTAGHRETDTPVHCPTLRSLQGPGGCVGGWVCPAWRRWLSTARSQGEWGPRAESLQLQGHCRL